MPCSRLPGTTRLAPVQFSVDMRDITLLWVFNNPKGRLHLRWLQPLDKYMAGDRILVWGASDNINGIYRVVSATQWDRTLEEHRAAPPFWVQDTSRNRFISIRWDQKDLEGPVHTTWAKINDNLDEGPEGGWDEDPFEN